jgi:hypothetical protein
MEFVSGSPASGRATRSENGALLATYDIELDMNGNLFSSRRLKEGEVGKNVWYAYVETNPDGDRSPWFNGQTYVDTLSKDAMARFINITHEVYKKKVGDRFGTVIPCIFTDEPQMVTKTTLDNAHAKNDVFMPWTHSLPDTFRSYCGLDLLANLPELFWNLPADCASELRYHYHNHTTDLFVTAFLDQIGTWCKTNNIVLNGHLMDEPTLGSQTGAVGDAMRCYRSMGMPGMDLLVDGYELNTAKQVVSVARQNGHRGAMCEIYGVTHWHFGFEGHKGQGEWQAAMGITMRVQHLAWCSMKGEGKRDYPASIGYQSPWFREYKYIEDHFARLGVVLTRGRPVTRVAVVHPIESYWLGFGPGGSGDEQWRRDAMFAELTRWLVQALIDFDFISEALLPDQVGDVANKQLNVGACAYDVVILPNLRTIRSTTLKILKAFVRAGGRVIILGSAYSLVDAKVMDRHDTISPVENIFWGEQALLSALDDVRDIRVEYHSGSPYELLYQMRQDGDDRFTFICNHDRNNPIDTTIHFKGKWQIDVMDTFTGKEYHAPPRLQTEGRTMWTLLRHKFEGCGSVLLRLSPWSSPTHSITSADHLPPRIDYMSAPTAPDVQIKSVELSEPNVLLLDYAEYRLGLDGGAWGPRTEVLRIDNTIRSQLLLPLKGEAFKQPWAVPAEQRAFTTFVTLRFMFESTYHITENTMLAHEDAEKVTINLNGTLIPSVSSTSPLGWWVDEDIRTVPIPAHTIRQGTNVLTLGFPFGILTNIERIYLLGNFAVELRDDNHTTLLKPLDLKTLTWGDITTQGLPFYAGNITYNCNFTIPRSTTLSPDPSHPDLALSTPHFSSPVLKVTSTSTSPSPSSATISRPKSEHLGYIAFQPRLLPLPTGYSNDGTHDISITAFGDRYNAFGHLHVPDDRNGGCGPWQWRTGGEWWTDGYRVRGQGVLGKPEILVGTVGVVVGDESGDDSEGAAARGQGERIGDEEDGCVDEEWVEVVDRV